MAAANVVAPDACREVGWDLTAADQDDDTTFDDVDVDDVGAPHAGTRFVDWVPEFDF